MLIANLLVLQSVCRLCAYAWLKRVDTNEFFKIRTNILSECGLLCTVFVKRNVFSDICPTVVTEKKGRTEDGEHYYRTVNKADGK